MQKQNAFLRAVNPMTSRLHGKFFYKSASMLPKVIMIELTNKCNLRCSICPKKIMTRCEGFMDDDTFKRIIHNVSEINAKNMVVGNFDFSAFGEALLHPKFFEYVEYAKDHLGKVIISAATNGMLLTGENRKRIIQSKLDLLTISFDGTSREMYEKIRCGGDFGQVSENIRQILILKEESSKRKPIIEILILETPENVNGVLSFKKKWAYAENILGVRLFFREMHNWGQHVSGVRTLRDKNSGLYIKLPCFRLRDTAIINWQGDVVPCCFDYDSTMVLGNINDKKLADIWTGTKKRGLIAKIIANRYSEVPLCRNCSIPFIYVDEVLPKILSKCTQSIFNKKQTITPGSTTAPPCTVQSKPT